MRFDGAGRVLELGVRHLLGEETDRWDLPFLPDRLALGRSVHLARAERRRREVVAYQSEVTLKLVFSFRGYTVILHGRADGLSEESCGLCVEEVKSTAMEGPQLRLLSAADFPAARLQLGIYLYMLSMQGQPPALGRLILCPVFDASAEYVLELLPFHREVEAFLFARTRELLDDFEARERWYAFRRHGAQQVPFPYPSPRPVQLHMGAEVLMALEGEGRLLLEAPTGAGKTAAVMHAALSYALAHDLRIYLATARTTGQASPVSTVLELKKRGRCVGTVILSARDKVCPTPGVACVPDACSLLARTQAPPKAGWVYDILGEGNPIDRLRLLTLATRMQVCPFWLELELAAGADVVIGDYNYVFGPSAYQKDLFERPGGGKWLLLIDEAHNLPERARAYYQPRLSWQASMQLARWASSRPDAIGARVMWLVEDFQRYVCDVGLSVAAEGDLPDTLFEPDLRKLGRWREVLARVLLDDPMRRGPPSIRGIEDPVLRFYREVVAFAQLALELDDATETAFVRVEGDVQLRVICKDASHKLKKRLDSFAGVVAMSATLSPSEFYRRVLGFSADAPHAVFPSPFPRAHRRVVIVPYVSDRFEARGEAMAAFAEVVLSALEVRPGVYAVYAPSFEFIKELCPHLRERGLELLIQPEVSDDAARAAVLRRLATYRNEGAPSRRGLLLMAVMGGVFAEAIDLPSGVASGVIVLTPGLPPPTLERERLRAYFDERFGEGFEYAYVYPGMTRVIQAAGRLIRRDEDIGVIVLVGERFATPRYSRLLPRDWYDLEPGELVVRELKPEIQTFWEHQSIEG